MVFNGHRPILLYSVEGGRLTTGVDEEEEFEAVRRAVEGLFEMGRENDYASLREMCLDDGRFSRFGDFPPYERTGIDDTAAVERARFSSLKDFHYDIADLKVDFFEDVAVATFYVHYGGVLLNNYIFQGKSISKDSRGSVVLVKREGEWKVAHQHFSPLPEKLSFW